MPDNPRKSSSDNSLVNPTGHTALSTHIPLMCAVAQSFLTLYDPSVAHQAPLSMGFYRQEYWRGLPFPSPRDLPDARIEPVSYIS